MMAMTRSCLTKLRQLDDQIARVVNQIGPNHKRVSALIRKRDKLLYTKACRT